MKLKKSFLILLLAISYSFLSAQTSWKTKFGIWANIELYEKLGDGQPFDSTINITPRFLWLKTLKELEIEKRFEQKRKYSIIKVTNNCIFINDAHFLLKGDTIIMKDKYHNVVKFVKYK